MRFSICIRFCLQNHAVLFQQRLCRCHRIHTLGVLYRGKFLVRSTSNARQLSCICTISSTSVSNL